MNQLKITMKNCYGIREMNETFDLAASNVHAIYAANGCMKTSFALCFSDYAASVNSKDRVFPARQTVRDLLNESGAAISPEDVLVIKPIDEMFTPSQRTSLLLVNSTLSLEYAQLHAQVDTAVAELLKALKDTSGLKKGIEEEISHALTGKEGLLLEALAGVLAEVRENQDTSLSAIPYPVIFDPKVLSVLAQGDVRQRLAAFIGQYNALLEQSLYFKKVDFNLHGCNSIAKSLKDHGFFRASHTLNLKASENLEVTSETELYDLIENEKKKILSDKALKKAFDDIEKILVKNQDTRAFQEFLSAHPDMASRLSDIEELKKDVWKAYLALHVDLLDKAVAAYVSAKARRSEIEAQALSERTAWEDVVGIFNDRFDVPFRLTVENRVSVVLEVATLPTLGFTFHEDDGDQASITRNDLTTLLSTGERRALYTLNLLFDIQARMKAGRTTLIIADDIADSFDYKNKYAIVEYLRELADSQHIKLIILTHNFDFFRTLESRSVVTRKYCKIAVKSDAGIKLEEFPGLRNVFVNVWKKRYHTDPKIQLACIPFMRNLIEYTRGTNTQEYSMLTSLLHWKADTASLTRAQLDRVYNKLFNKSIASDDGASSVLDLLREQAQLCLAANDAINFENKVVLSIATRMEAEIYMEARIADKSKIAAIKRDQTPEFLKLLLQSGGVDSGTASVLNRVVLMTPANIHLNSFMYEPIMDMSDSHLRKLYRQVLQLS